MHTYIYTHVVENLCLCVYHHKHTSGKRQHCKILVRFFFTHHWLRLFPSLDLDYVTVRKVKDSAKCVKIETENVRQQLVTHTFQKKKKISQCIKTFGRKCTPTTASYNFHLFKKILVLLLMPQYILIRGENKDEAEINHKNLGEFNKSNNNLLLLFF